MRMDTRFAAWATRVSRFPPEVWHTGHRIYNTFHYVRLGALEENPDCRGMIRPTPLGVAAAKLYCERSGLEIE